MELGAQRITEEAARARWWIMEGVTGEVMNSASAAESVMGDSMVAVFLWCEEGEVGEEGIGGGGL